MISATVVVKAIETAVVVVARATNQAILLALGTTYLTALVACEPAVRTKDVPLRTNLSLALAKYLRLIARDLPRAYAAPDALAIRAVTLSERDA